MRSRLVRSALRDHRVVLETVKTCKMISEFKMNIVIWLEQHGLGHKSELLTSIPDVSINKVCLMDHSSWATIHEVLTFNLWENVTSADLEVEGRIVWI